MNFPAALFEVDDSIRSVQGVMEKLGPLGLKWQVESDPANRRVRALAPLFANPETKEIWAVAAVENWGSPRHLHNPGGIYGEVVITLAGELDDIADDGTPVKCTPGTVLYHDVNTIHQATGPFWAGIYHQPRGSTPKPIEE
jgi:hypothetical protein